MKVKNVLDAVSSEDIRDRIRNIIHEYSVEVGKVDLLTGRKISEIFTLNIDFSMDIIILSTIGHLSNFVDTDVFDTIYNFVPKYIDIVAEIYQAYLEDKIDTKFVGYIKNNYIVFFTGMIKDEDTKEAASFYKNLMRIVDINYKDSLPINAMAKIREEAFGDSSEFIKEVFGSSEAIPKDILKNMDMDNTDESIYKSQLSNIRDDYTIISDPRNSFLNDYLIDEETLIGNIKFIISSNDLDYTITEDFLGYLNSIGCRMISVRFKDGDTIYRVAEHIDRIYLLYMNGINLNGYEVYPELLENMLEIEPDDLKYSFKVNDDLFDLSNNKKE